jgi:hypothetical protein
LDSIGLSAYRKEQPTTFFSTAIRSPSPTKRRTPTRNRVAKQDKKVKKKEINFKASVELEPAEHPHA